MVKLYWKIVMYHSVYAVTVSVTHGNEGNLSAEVWMAKPGMQEPVDKATFTNFHTHPFLGR